MPAFLGLRDPIFKISVLGPDNQANIFTPICAGCHGGANPAANLSLDAAHSYNDLVNVPSTEEPTLNRVKPGDPTNSFLVIHMQKDGDGAPASGTLAIPVSVSMPAHNAQALLVTPQSTLPPGPYKVVLNMDPSVAVHSQSGAPLGLGTVEVGERLVTRFSVAAGR